MNVFLFFLKSLGASMLLGTILGAITGFILTIFKSEHPHQIFASYFIFSFLGVIISLITCLVVASVITIIEKPDWSCSKVTILTSIITFAILIGFLLMSIL